MTFTAPAVTKVLTTEGHYEAIPVQKILFKCVKKYGIYEFKLVYGLKSTVTVTATIVTNLDLPNGL